MSGEGIQMRKGWWRTRCGHAVRIIANGGPVRYPWVDSGGCAYSGTGRFDYDREHPLDLVEFISENTTITAREAKTSEFLREHIEVLEKRISKALETLDFCTQHICVQRPQLEDLLAVADILQGNSPETGGEA